MTWEQTAKSIGAAIGGLRRTGVNMKFGGDLVNHDPELLTVRPGYYWVHT